MKLSELQTAFVYLAAIDKRMQHRHVSIYFGVLIQWKVALYANPFELDKELLGLCLKHTRRGTLNSSLRELSSAGYLSYVPAVNRYTQPLVEVNDLSPFVVLVVLSNRFSCTDFDKLLRFSLTEIDKLQVYLDNIDKLASFSRYEIDKLPKSSLTKNDKLEVYLNNIDKLESFSRYEIDKLPESSLTKNDKLEVYLNNIDKLERGYLVIIDKLESFLKSLLTAPNRSESRSNPNNSTSNETTSTSVEGDTSVKKETYIYTSINKNINRESIENNACARENGSTQEQDQHTTQHQSKKSRKPKFEPPTEEEVSFYIGTFCKEQLQKTNADKWRLGSSVFEQQAAKFCNHYEAIGWVVGKNKPMRSWQASARNWMLNYHEFNPDKKAKLPENYLDVNEDKDYDIPL